MMNPAHETCYVGVAELRRRPLLHQGSPGVSANISRRSLENLLNGVKEEGATDGDGPPTLNGPHHGSPSDIKVHPKWKNFVATIGPARVFVSVRNKKQV